MTHEDHVRLLQGGIRGPGGVWADLGSGWGAFTLALADLLGPGAAIYSVDKDRGGLREQEKALQSRFPDTTVHYIAADFTRPLDLPPLDGIVMANSLHYQRHKVPVLQLVRGYLKPGGRLISYPTWERLAQHNGFSSTQLLATVPSRFLREIYAALSM